MSELAKVAPNLQQAEFLDCVIMANAQAAHAEYFGYEMTTPALVQTAVKGGSIVRAFWWGFHIEISHTDLRNIANSPDPVTAVIRSIGGNAPGAASPFIAAAAAFIAGALKPLQALDQGRGVYVSMSWFAPGVFVPTTV